MTGHEEKSGLVRTLIDNSFLLIAGAVTALLWANLASLPVNQRPVGSRKPAIPDSLSLI